MKRWTLLILIAAMLLTAFPLSAAAATVSVADEILNLKEYYAETTRVTLWEEVLSFSSLGMLSERIDVTLGLNNASAEGMALEILSDAARSVAVESERVSRLSGLQKEDGSFGTAKQTALAITVLSLSDNEEEREAMNGAAKYFAAFPAETEQELCWQIMGITDAGFDANTTKDRDLLAKLLSYQNNATYSYSDTYDTTEAEALPTALALMTYDTVNRSGSPMKRLAQNGNLSRYTLSDFRPLLIAFGVLLFLSVLFWIYIFLHKKNRKTLDETKIY